MPPCWPRSVTTGGGTATMASGAGAFAIGLLPPQAPPTAPRTSIKTAPVTPVTRTDSRRTITFSSWGGRKWRWLAIRRRRRHDARTPLQKLAAHVDESTVGVEWVRGLLDVGLHLVVPEVIGEEREASHGALHGRVFHVVLSRDQRRRDVLAHHLLIADLEVLVLLFAPLAPHLILGVVDLLLDLGGLCALAGGVELVCDLLELGQERLLLGREILRHDEVET